MDIISTEKIQMLMKSYLHHIGIHISPLGSPTLRITGGEPLISPNVVKKLFEYVLELNSSECDTKFEKIVLDTNGINLKKFYSNNINLFNQLKDMLLIKVSLDSLDTNTLKRIMKKQQQISANKLKSIREAIEQLSKNGFKIEINTVLSMDNVDEIPRIYEYAKKIGLVGIKILSKNSFGGLVAIDENDNIAVEKIKQYMSNLKNSDNFTSEFPYLNYDSGVRMERLIDKITKCKLTFVNHDYKSSSRTYSDFCKTCKYKHKCSTGIMSITMRADGEISFCRHGNSTKNIKQMDELNIDQEVDKLMDAYIRCYHYFEEPKDEGVK